MVRTLYLAGENIIINISHPFDGLLAEEDCWFGVLDFDFAHRDRIKVQMYTFWKNKPKVCNFGPIAPILTAWNLL